MAASSWSVDSTPPLSHLRRTAPHSAKKCSGTHGSALGGRRRPSAFPVVVSAAISTPAEASTTTLVTPRRARGCPQGVGGGGIELDRLGVVQLREPASEGLPILVVSHGENSSSMTTTLGGRSSARRAMGPGYCRSPRRTPTVPLAHRRGVISVTTFGALSSRWCSLVAAGVFWSVQSGSTVVEAVLSTAARTCTTLGDGAACGGRGGGGGSAVDAHGRAGARRCWGSAGRWPTARCAAIWPPEAGKASRRCASARPSASRGPVWSI